MTRRRPSPSPAFGIAVALKLVWALACLLASAWLAAQHPTHASLLLAAVALAMAGCWRWPLASIAGPVACVGFLSFAPWTGWMLVEEFDVLLLAALAGGWAGVTCRDRQQPADGRLPPDGTARVAWLLALAYAAVVAWSVRRGLADGGAWPLVWSDALHWEGWREPANSLRAVKGLVLALLVWPLWQALQSRWPGRAAEALAAGALASLAVVSLVATWERWAWVGLSNFSTDYRTTALFWEMHVGGAALDAFLALTIPFVLHGLHAARNRVAWLLVAATAVAAGYAVLTTFSRGLYLAMPVAGILWAWAAWRAPRGAAATDDSGASKDGPRGAALATVTWLGFMVGAWWVFEAGGYRGLLAWWGLFMLGLAGQSVGTARSQEGRHAVWLTALSVGFGIAASALAIALPSALKAPYLLYALIGVAGVAAAVAPLRVPWRWWSAWAALLPVSVAVSWHWAADPATRWVAAAPVIALGAAGAWLAWWPARASNSMAPVRRVGPRAVVLALAAMGLGAVLIGTLGGGAYLGERVSSVQSDWQGRLDHWRRSASLVQSGEEAALGIGAGRFPARFALSGEATDQTGDYHWTQTPEGGRLVLTAGKHTLGWGELFRMSQRIGPVPAGPLTLRWQASGDSGTRLHAEVCQKHLLYDAGCRTAQAPLGSDAGDTAVREMVLDGAALTRSPVFSIAIDTPGKRVEFDRLSLVDASGRELLANGGFDRGLQRWLPSSDRHHLPWHAKNLALHVWIEQGWAGLAGLGGLTAFALARLTLGRARHHPLAAPLIAGLAALLVVGLFDSVLDNPRIAWLWFVWLGVAATLRWEPRRPAISR